MILSKNNNKDVIARPFVKWAGGKGYQLQRLEELLPTDFDNLQNVTYIEPFVGGGAMLFYMLRTHKCIKRVVINDINPDLIHCYQLIVKSPSDLIKHLKSIEDNYNNTDYNARKELYYTYRNKYNNENLHADERAALLIFLNHTCYNGLYRVNSIGKFNVPFGRYKRPVICNEELIMQNHRLLAAVDITVRQPGDYKNTAKNLSKKNPNFVYLDPPYRPLSGTSYFKEYSNSPFGDEQQKELKQFCDKLTNHGCLIMQNNSDSKNGEGESFFEQLYDGYHIERVYVPRFINASPKKREKLAEIVIRNY